MRIETTVKSLTAALAAVKPAIDRKATIPILRHVLLSGGCMTATDLQISVIVPIPGKATGEPVCADHKALSDALKGLPKASEVTLADGVLTCGAVTLRLGAMADENYPVLPTNLSRVGLMPAASVMRLLRETRFAISNEDSRFTLNGALLEGHGETARMVATDGHRLSQSDVSGELASGFKTLLPAPGLSAMAKAWAKADGLLVIGADENHISISDDHGTEILMRKLTGNFPDYERVIPRPAPQTIHLAVNRLALLAAIGRAASSADPRTKAVKLVLNGCCKVTASHDGLSYSEDVAASWDGPEDFAIGLNGNFLTDALSCIDDETITLETKGPSQMPSLYAGAAPKDPLACDCAVVMRLASSIHVIIPMCV